MNWKECNIKKLVKTIRIDHELIKSLIDQSNKKIITDKFSPLNQDTASTKISNNYDSLREILEALSIKNGFKTYNHECFTGFLKEILKMEKESYDFDNFRRIRNSINYYGKNIPLDPAKKLLIDITELRNKLLEKLNE